MKEQEFSLLEEAWIYVMWTDYHISKVSLTEALLQAHQIRDLSGESKTQDVALFRLLLAVVYTVFTRENEQGEEERIETPQEALRRWGELWKLGSFPDLSIKRYLEQWQDRFWLFHPERPFYQVPELKGTTNPAKKLNGSLVESNNKVQLFSVRSGETKNHLQYDEAARWLVHLQGFGDTAAKNPSPKLSWLGSIGLIQAKGRNLFETLMLNLVLEKDGTAFWEEPTPIWELPKLPQEKLREVPIPNNQPELLTLQCRRVQLLREHGMVTGYLEAAGDYIQKENAFSEQMTLWEGIKEKGAVVGYRPHVCEMSRQMWRDFPVLMGQTGKEPGIVSWISLLRSRRKLDKSRVISFQTVGVQYGNMFCGIVDEYSDELQMYTGLLDELGQKWQKLIHDEVEHCEKLSRIVWKLAYDIDKAKGGDGTTMAQRAQEQCYFRLDLPFRQWLLTIDPDTDTRSVMDCRNMWRTQAKRIALQLGLELVEQGGTVAFVGRTVKEKDKKKEVEYFYCAPKAFNWFRYELKEWEGTKV